MRDYKNCPDCGQVDCFANEVKHCIILTKKDFGIRKCPFFKTKQQAHYDKAKRERAFLDTLANTRKGE